MLSTKAIILKSIRHYAKLGLDGSKINLEMLKVTVQTARELGCNTKEIEKAVKLGMRDGGVGN